MEKKEKLSRLASLQKLKKQRNKEENEQESEHENENLNEEYSENEEEDDGEDLKDFIEDDETEEMKAKYGGKKLSRKGGKFFKTTLDGSKSDSLKDEHPKSVVKDDFFKNLVAQISDEEAEGIEGGKSNETGQLRSNDMPVVADESNSKRKAKDTKKPRIKKSKSSSGIENKDDDDGETEYQPLCETNVAFPEPAPESSRNQLEINNMRAMEIDEEAEAEDVEFPDEADLKQFEEEMSFIIDNNTDNVNNGNSESSQRTSQSHSQSQPLTQPKSQSQSSQSQTPSFGLVASAEEFQEASDDGSCLVYWFDAYERQPNGPVYLFGKMKDPKAPTGLSTCCVIVENIQRNLFFLPREAATFEELGNEVSELASQYGITRFGFKPVSRKYAFEMENVPRESEYLKMVYPYNSSPQLPMSLEGKHFSHVFGTNTSALEMLLIKRKIMGPCWLKIKPASITAKSASWCRTELIVTDTKQLNPLQASECESQELPAPPMMTAMSISLRTVMNAESKAHEIVCISALIYDAVDIDGSRSTAADRPKCSAAFTVVRALDNEGFSADFSANAFGSAGPNNIRVEAVKSEKALLNYFVAQLQRHDPDILVGHNFLGFDLGVLLHRMRACKTEFWSKMGRLQWSQWPKSKASGNNNNATEASYAERQIMCGRIVCDTYLAAKDLVKAKNYSLGTLAESQLGLQRAEFDYERVKDYFNGPPDVLRQLLSGNERDAYYIAMLMFQMLILPLTLQLTTIAGNLWSRTLTGARAERNEFLLLHEFHNQKYICPDRQPFAAATPAYTIGEDDENAISTAKATSGRRKPAYSGGLVLEPKKGFYDRIVLLLDFNSLYPSIIQEYNICFTTVERDNEKSSNNSEEIVPAVPDSSLPAGVLPRILKTLVERRRAVKSMMKKGSNLSTSQLASLNIRQQALKLTANSMYGCLGFSHSRFYAKPLAILITAKGREILQSTVNLTREVCQSDVIYGDTDSIMVNTRSRSLVEARALGQKIKKTVNERYRLLEIELDGIFQKLLLLKKKKYAALVVEEERPDGSILTRLETKGLDLVRRDWCELSVEASTKILDQIMNNNNVEGENSVTELAPKIHETLRQVALDLQENRVPLEKFIISKNLTKDPSAYADARTQPHVTVALRMRQRGLSASSGDTIPYVICQPTINNNSSNNSTLADLAFHPDELRKDASLRLDVNWYLQTQLHPPIARLCEHIEGTDSSQLAAALGLDPRKFRSMHQSSNANSEDSQLISSSTSRFASLLSDEERFAAIEKLNLACPGCAARFEFTGIVKDIISENVTDSSCCLQPQMTCPTCNASLSISCLYYAAVTSLQRACVRYHAYVMKCDEVACQLETERLGVYDRKCPADGCKGSLRPLLPHAHLYTHLLYLKSLFNPEKLVARLANRLTPADNKLLQQLAAQVDPVNSFIDQKLAACAYPVIDFKQIFDFLHINEQ